MFDARQLLNALVGAAAKRLTGDPRGGVPGQSPLTNVLDNLFVPGQGGAADPYVQKVREFVNRNPQLAEAALTGIAGVLMRSSRSAGLATAAARLGGLALIGVLAYKAYQTYQGAKPAPGGGQGNLLGGGTRAGGSAQAAFDLDAATDDDALLFARAMVAAASADGPLDNNERARIVEALSQAGIDPQATRWLEDELASPAGVEDIADRVQTPEKAAQVYAAACLAIDPDTRQEREFLRQLAESLDIDPALARQIDEGAASVRS